MGILSSIFGGGEMDMSGINSLLGDERDATAKNKAKFDELKLKQAEEREALKARGKSMMGGGRTGLMYQGNQAGVL